MSKKIKTSQNVQSQNPTFWQALSNSFWHNLLKLVFLVAFAFILLLFPKEELVQWAAR